MNKLSQDLHEPSNHVAIAENNVAATEEASKEKIQASLQELSDHVAATKDKVAAAAEASKEKIQASLKKSKEDAKARQASFKASLSEKPAAAGLQWEELQDNVNQKIQQIKNERET